MNEEKTIHNIHIGSIIRTKIAERGFSEVELSKLLHCHPSNVYDMYKRKSINTDLLWKFSIILDYNFFSNIYGATLDKNLENQKDESITTIIISPEKISFERNNGIVQMSEYRKIPEK
jgi:hypothetical protein